MSCPAIFNPIVCSFYPQPDVPKSEHSHGRQYALRLWCNLRWAGTHPRGFCRFRTFSTRADFSDPASHTVNIISDNTSGHIAARASLVAAPSPASRHPAAPVAPSTRRTQLTRRRKARPPPTPPSPSSSSPPPPPPVRASRAAAAYHR